MIYRLLMFLSSYAPLWFILGIRFWNSNFSYVCISIGLLSLLFLAFWIIWGYRQNGNDFEIESDEEAGAEAAGYLASYLLPFFNIEAPTTNDLFVYAGFFFTAAMIYVRSNIMRINPSLYVVGFWIVQIVDKTGARRYLITRKPVSRGEIVKAVDMGGGILLLKSIRI